MGLDVQRNHIVAYAAANGLTVTEWQQDVESGATERRGGLDTLRAKVAAGGIGTILDYRRLRPIRYIGLVQARLGHLLTAALNFLRLGERFADIPRAKARRSPFVTLMAA